jgi:signal transduction histidine kinase
MTAPREPRVVAAELAHDANNMLSVVLACAEYLLRHGPGTTSVLQDLHAAASRASELVRKIATTDARGAGDELVAIDDVLAQIEGMLRMLGGPRVELSIIRAAGTASVRAPRDRLENVVINLACNACDAMSREGRLEIDTAIIERASGPHVRLTVRDSGAGMDEATRMRAFEPYFTTKQRGTGLGLSVALNTVAELGGVIEVESAPGEGTTMRLFLPCEG